MAGKDSKGTIVAAVIAGLFALAGIVLSYFLNQQSEKTRAAEKRAAEAEAKVETYRRKYESSGPRFVTVLGSLIDRAEPTKEMDAKTMMVRAQAIVSTRNGLRSKLEAMGSSLDSEIDELEKELRKPTPDANRIAMLLRVLKEKWPSKASEIELAGRKLQTELGLVPQ